MVGATHTLRLPQEEAQEKKGLRKEKQTSEEVEGDTGGRKQEEEEEEAEGKKLNEVDEKLEKKITTTRPL